MNSPKEKALELVEKYHTQEIDVYIGSGAMTYESAKQCALIAVDEILGKRVSGHLGWKEVEYWYEVKTEIENL